MLLAGLACFLLAACGPPRDKVETFRFANKIWTADTRAPDTFFDLNERRRAMAYQCYRERRYRAAYELFQDWWNEAPTAEGAMMLGLTLTRSTPDKGPASLELATRLAPEWDQAWVALAWGYCQRHDYDRAAAAADELRRRTGSRLALATVDAVRHQREHDRFWELVRLERGTILAALGLALLALIPLRWLWRFFRRWQAGHRLEQDLRRLTEVAAGPLEQASEKLVYQNAALRCSRHLREVLQSLHLQGEAARYEGLRGQLEIYRQALRQLDRLELNEPRRQRVRTELEAMIRRMMQELHDRAGA